MCVTLAPLPPAACPGKHLVTLLLPDAQAYSRSLSSNLRAATLCAAGIQLLQKNLGGGGVGSFSCIPPHPLSLNCLNFEGFSPGLGITRG